MNNIQFKYLNSYYNLDLDEKILKKFNLFENLFLEYNEHTNLMSKGDTSLLFEKHIFDSCAGFMSDDIKKSEIKILDIGSGGGFPSIILAMILEKNKFILVDSIAKKTKFISDVIKKLELKNVEVVNARSENIKSLNVDIITSRAVGKMSYVYNVSHKHLKDGGKYVFWKGTPEIFQAEIDEFKLSHKNTKFKIQEYILPTTEKHIRNLITMEI